MLCAIWLADCVFVPLNSMCSRMWDNPAPRCWSSSMLPVAHHACTLATGALRSSCTITVSPFGKIHFCAVLGGNIIRAEDSGGAAFKLTMGNNRAAVRKLATGMRYISETFDYKALLRGKSAGDQITDDRQPR